MKKFERLLETCYHELDSDPMKEKGDRLVIDALERGGIKTGKSKTGCFDFWDKEGNRYSATIEKIGAEDEESATSSNETLTPDDEKALNMARNMSTKPKNGLMGTNTPQGKMDKAYGDMMDKVSNKIRTVASRI